MSSATYQKVSSLLEKPMSTVLTLILLHRQWRCVQPRWEASERAPTTRARRSRRALLRGGSGIAISVVQKSVLYAPRRVLLYWSSSVFPPRPKQGVARHERSLASAITSPTCYYDSLGLAVAAAPVHEHPAPCRPSLSLPPLALVSLRPATQASPRAQDGRMGYRVTNSVGDCLA